MNYKKKLKYKIGGSPQTSNNVSPEPQVSTSVKNSYNKFKDILYNIKIYIKSNFIFVLLVSVLLIFYVYLMFSEPLTAEDLQETVETIKCGHPERGWTGGCPNKVLAEDKDCVNNNCDRQTCCVNELNCSDWEGVCRGNNFDIKDTNTCSLDIDGDCSEKCCVMKCNMFSNSRCPPNQIKKSDNFCSKPEGSDDYVCNYVDCCEIQKTCITDNYSCESQSKMLSNTASSINCPNNECNDNICCVDKPDVRCNSYDGCADSQLQLRDNADNLICSNGICTDDLCCINPPSSQQAVDCSTFTDECPTDTTYFSQYQCNSGSCTQEECCKITCATSFTPEQCDQGTTFVGSHACPTGTCTEQDCCSFH